MANVVKLGGPSEGSAPRPQAGVEPQGALRIPLSQRTLLIIGGSVAAALTAAALWFSFGSALVPYQSPERPSVSSPEVPSAPQPRKVYNTNSDGNSYGD